MRRTLVAAGFVLAIGSTAGAAQEDAAAAPTCFIEIQKLMAEPPDGVGDLGAAVRKLDETLRPQVAEINRLKAELERLEQRQTRAMQADDEEGGSDPLAMDEEVRKVAADLDARQEQLKLDYAAQQRAIVGPVQTHVSQRAQAFASERGCAEIRMIRAPEMAGLQAAGAQNVTGDFVGWYVANKS